MVEGNKALQSTKGWNWGNYTLEDDHLDFKVDGKPCFIVPYKDIALANVQTKNEISLEFQQEENAKDKSDIICEMRFFIPNQEADGADKENESNVSAAQRMKEKISEKANLGEFAGDAIASVKELPFMIPRGKYTLDLYTDFLKMHGTTHDYKVIYKDIEKAFMLEKPDGKHVALVIQLRNALRQGQTLHHFLVIQTAVDKEEKVKLNLSEDALK